MNNEGQLLFPRNAPFSSNNLQDTNHLVIGISHDKETRQMNDERQADTQNEIGANDPISRNEYQDANYFGQSYFAK